MRLKAVIDLLASDLRTHLEDAVTYGVDVATYRLDSQTMENWNRTGPRIAIYDGGDNASASIPGAAQFRGDRVSWGVPYAKVQVIRIDLAWYIAERTQDGWNEQELVALCDVVRDWIDDLGATIGAQTDGGFTAFMYGSSNGITRLRKYAYTTITTYGIINKD